jgi:hypothetical protein
VPYPSRDDMGTPGGAVPPAPALRRPSTMSSATPAAPPRPRVTSDLRPPRPTDRPPRPVSIAVAASFWTTSFIVGLAAFIAGYTDRATVRARLTASAVAEDPTIAADVLHDGVTLTMATVLAVNAVIMLLAGLCLILVLRGRRTARWFLVLLGLVTLLAIDFDQDFVSGGIEIDRIALLVEGALVIVGTVALLTRASGAWLRSARR